MDALQAYVLRKKLEPFACLGDIGRPGALPVLDGARGLAALLVLLQHTLHPLPNIGMVGVWIFFALSGLLMVQPYFTRRDAYSLNFTARYLLRRAARVLPMYAVTVLLWAWCFGKDTLWVKNHLLFVWSEYMLWTMKQELLFYLVVPPLMLALLFIKKPEHKALVLAALSVLAGSLLTPDVLSMGAWRYTLEGEVPFFLGVFLAGMSVGCLLHSRWIQEQSEQATEIGNASLSAALILGAGLMLVFSGPGYPDSDMTWTYHLQWGWLAAFLLLHALLHPGQWIARVLRFLPLRALGIVGYSFYLLQLIPIIYLSRFGIEGPLQFVLALPLAYLMACVGYCIVEKPFMKRTGWGRSLA